MRPTKAAAMSLTLLAISGCGGAGAGSSSSESKPAATKTVTVTATPTPPKHEGVLKVGTEGTVSFGRVTALKLDPDVQLTSRITSGGPPPWFRHAQRTTRPQREIPLRCPGSHGL